MHEFLVELYRPRSASALACAAHRARVGAQEVTRTGTPVRFVRAIFVPDDEICFHLYEAATAEAAGEAARRAGVVFERVLPAITEPR